MPNLPNLLFICTDQQSATMMSCAGNPYLNTPAMDSLAATGVRFDRAYCANPVCGPSRFSLLTGRYPSEIGQRSNDVGHIEKLPPEIIENGLGQLFRQAGYETAYGGKQHLPKMTVEDLGFDYIERDEREQLAESCAKFVRRDHDKPYLLFASFINPHDICYMAIRDFASTEQEKRLMKGGRREIEMLDDSLQLPEGVSHEEFFEKHCPPVPPNFEPQVDEPEAIRMLLAQRPFKFHARENWSEERWRLHRWSYCKLTERVDSEIGQVLNALRESGQEQNTVVIFTSDHGDHDSSHRMEHKTVPYDEAARIPLIVSQPGVTPAGAIDDSHLVSNGLDLFPTLCDYAGIEVPSDLKGQSFRPLAEGKSPEDWRQYLLIECETGKAVVTDRYKYILYDEGESREQLMDLQVDPHETRNAAGDADKADVLEKHRRLLAE